MLTDTTTVPVSSLIAGAAAAALSLSAISAHADDYFDFDCKPTQVVERSDRVGVKCSNSTVVMDSDIDEIRFLAIDKTDSGKISRYIAFANAALLAKKYFWVRIPSSADSNVSGCLKDNCRTPVAFGIRE